MAVYPERRYLAGPCAAISITRVRFFLITEVQPAWRVFITKIMPAGAVSPRRAWQGGESLADSSAVRDKVGLAPDQKSGWPIRYMLAERPPIPGGRSNGPATIGGRP